MLKERGIQISAEDVVKREYGRRTWSRDKDDILKRLEGSLTEIFKGSHKGEIKEMESMLREFYDNLKETSFYKKGLENVKRVSKKLEEKKLSDIKIYTEEVDKFIIQIITFVADDVKHRDCYVLLCEFGKEIKEIKEEKGNELGVEFYFGMLFVQK
jgi:hypothetical protein